MRIEGTQSRGNCGRRATCPYVLPDGVMPQPMPGQCLLEPCDPPMSSVIHLPETSTSRPVSVLCRVVAVARGRMDAKGRLVEPEFCAGDLVVVGLVATEMWSGDRFLLMCRHDNVLAKVGDEP